MPDPDTLVLFQSGGPTAVVNASLVGAIRAARSDERVRAVLGARFGFEGLLGGSYADLGELGPSQLGRLAKTPGPALASSRLRPSDQDLGEAVRSLAERGVGWLSVIGGNDSADLMQRLHLCALVLGVPLNVVGIPKTVDNDLPFMDHTPGYGSAARALARYVRGSALDTAALRRTDPVKIIEVPGRNSGWLAAASALARSADRSRRASPLPGRHRSSAGGAPHVIFLPERPRPLAHMVQEVRVALEASGFAVVVISENQTNERSEPLAGGAALDTDPYGHPYFESPGLALAAAIRQASGVSARYERPGSFLRSLAGGQSRIDVAEAVAVGAEAVRRALAGESGIMVTVERAPGPQYRVSLGTAPLEAIAREERRLPDEFIATSGTDVTPAFLRYVRPLVGGRLPDVMDLSQG
ncbi:MAG: diphosphate--fructose-6-phosphate 1-phosphotransferase [Chloroflexi bacterium]|nr:diphosphate--fructose-6-phosphate 1-phosphotransferase [Chloroflexota bacterium]